MHIIIAILTAAAGLIWALYRLQNSGVDLNSFNPFYWMRRKKWQAEVGTKPLHRLQSPMEAAAVLVVAMIELDGVVTREAKAEIIKVFSHEFDISDKEAIELYAASSHLLKNSSYIPAEVKMILAPSKEKYQRSQQESLLKMLHQVSTIEGEANKTQLELIAAVNKQFI
ncbi:MAG TPA: TerB family tellurite resistance protein [Cellvibrionaceae bacterium]